MSNDGNKSTKRAPFTMFSSSAGGGYLDNLHTEFTGGVEINNLHTDIYSDYRSPPAQGPFTEQLVGGSSYRHQEVASTEDRKEGFFVTVDPGTITIGKSDRVQVYRDEYAKRPLNIRNIKEEDGKFSNYNTEYEVIQIAGRTLNPRHFVENPAEYTTDYPLHRGTEGRVLNDLDADGNPATGSLADYTLPGSSSTDQFVFVNKFSAPGDRYTMSRGFLNPKGEEFSAYNASPFRNLNVRQELTADLATHTPKATSIPPASGTLYHTTNRNPVESTAFGDHVIYKDSSEWTHTVAFDEVNKKVYWVTDDSGTGNNVIKRANPDGTDVEELASVAHDILKIVLDPLEGYMFWTTTTGAGTIYRSDLDAGSQTAIITGKDSPALSIDTVDKKLYYVKFVSPNDGIYQANYDGTGEVQLSGYTSQAIQSVAINSATKDIYWGTIFSSSQIRKAKVVGTTLADVEVFFTETSAVPRDIAVEQSAEKEVVYFTRYYSSNGVNKIFNGTLDRLTDITDNTRTYLALDSETRNIFWTPREVGEVHRSPLQVFDNGLVTHAIPRTDIQYSWIDSSALSRPFEFYGNQTGSEEITFYSGTIGFDSPMNNIYIDPVNATQSFDFTGSAYTYSSWKEIRGSELQLSRHYRKNNILPVTNNEDSTTQYIEPPVVAKHKPLDYLLAIDDTGAPYHVKSAYGNRLMRYSNDNINKLYDFRVSDDNTDYAKIKDLYLNKSITDPGNPIRRFFSLTYGETVFPQSKNAFTKKVRVRGKYTEVPGTGSNGYDRLYGTQNTFYSTTTQRTDGALNSQGATSVGPYSEKTFTENFIEGTEWANYAPRFGRDNTSGVVLDAVSGSHCFVFGGQENHNTQTRYLQIHDSVRGIEFEASGASGPYAPLALSESVPAGIPSLKLMIKSSSLGPGTELLGETAFRSWSSVAIAAPGADGIWSAINFSASFDAPMDVLIVQPADTFANWDDGQVALKDIQITYQPAIFKNANAFQPMKSDGTNSSFYTASFSSNVGELNSDTDVTLFHETFKPALAYFEEEGNIINHIIPDDPGAEDALDSQTNTQAILGYNERLIEQISGKAPFYDSYEDYNENEKHLIKEASILPEFRISEHMDYYVAEQNGNFRADNKKFLTILGADVSSSAESRASVTFDGEFESDYLSTGEVENLKKIKSDHIGYSNISKVTIKATGLQKLLPYNGFYPDTRTVQLGNLLSSSLAPGIKSYQYNSTADANGHHVESSNPTGYFGFLKAMASPGILYNSLKAGVSVDYPAYSSPPLMRNEHFDNQLGDLKLLEAPQIRLPFETLYNVDQNLPKNTNIYSVFSGDKLQDKEEVLPFYFQWDGRKKPSYELAMHNFLAESVGFFLKGSSLNNFISQPESKFLEVEADKKYYMDIILDDQTCGERNKFFNITGEKQKFPFYQSMLSSSAEEDSEYGFSTDAVSDGAGGYYAIVGDPEYLAGSQIGRIAVKHVDASGNITEILDSPGGLGHELGYAVTITSGSEGVFFAASRPGMTTDTGFVDYYRYRDTSGVTNLLNATPGSAGTNTRYGSKLTSLYDTSNDVVYFGVTDGPATNSPSSLRNLKMALNYISGSSSNQVNEAFDETFTDGSRASDGSNQRNTGDARDWIGIDIAKVGLNGHIMLAVSSQNYDAGGSGTSLGGAVATYYEGLPGTGTQSTTYADPVNPGNGGFGSDISVVETFTVDVVHSNSIGYVAVGRTEPLDGATAWTTTPSVALFKTEISAETDFQLSSGNLVNHEITRLGANTAIGIDTFGQSVDLQYNSDTESLKLFIADPWWATGSAEVGYNLLGRIEGHSFDKKSFSESQGNSFFPTGTLEYNIIPDYDNQTFMSPRFGSSMEVEFVDHTLLIAAGSPGYSASFSAGGISHVLYSSSSYQDYKQDGKLFGFPVDGKYDPSYCAYTPPGFYGQSIARLSFSASIGGPVTLEEIFRNVQVEDIVQLTDDRLKVTTGSVDTTLTTLQNDSKMNLSASVALFERVINPGVEFNISEDGDITKADRAVPSSKDSVRWAISTRYECPVFQASSSAYQDFYSSFDNNITASYKELDTGSFSYDLPVSPWTSYSTQESENNYTFTIRDSFEGAIDTAQTGSLIELCGFTPGTKNVGTVADNKTISEAIMVIPYTDRAMGKKTLEIESGKHFFRLNAAEVKRQKKSVEDNGFAVSEEIRETSISELLQAMKEYVIPPQYNFLSYKDVKPFAAYFLEFEHTLTKQDLKDIWQGISPSIGINPETQEVEISHNIDKHNMLYKVDIPNDIKFMVFKVKKKAEWNYYNITTDSTDDDRFRFDFQGNGQVEVVPEYSYNWPYDYFTLVERAKVDVDFTFEKPEEEE